MFKDISGKRFGKLIVLKFHNFKNHNAYWECVCDCGTNKIINGSDLRRGLKDGKGTKSCGCIGREKTRLRMKNNPIYVKKEFMLASKNMVFHGYKQSAKKRNIPFDLTFDEFILLAQQNCYYDGTPPLQSNKKGSYNGIFYHNGLDRRDSSKGYSLENCVPCCKTCNFAKRTLSEQEFYGWIKRIVVHRNLFGEDNATI